MEESFDAKEVLQAVGVFSRASADVVAALAERSTMMTVGAGSWLFREGDPSEHLYVVLSGRLEVLVESETGDRRLRIVSTGEAVGELGVLTGEPRSASVRALRDSELLCSDRQTIEALYAEVPGMAVAMIQAVSGHLWHRGTTDATHSKNSTVTVLIDSTCADTQACRLALSQSLAKICDVGVLDEGSNSDPVARGRALDRCERSHELTLAFADLRRVDDWWHFCTKQTDDIIIITSPTTEVPSEIQDLRPGHVAFVGPRSHTSNCSWLTHSNSAAHYQLGDSGEWDVGMDRLARALTGTSIGLVLSGGGARGFAHIGVLQVLKSESISVDRLGGCSMGSLIAALYAEGCSPEEIRRTCRRELVLANPFTDYTLPRASVLRARQAELMLRRIFGQGTLEATRLPCFTVSCDLVAARPVIHTTGPLYWTVGVSMSIPGLVPPTIDGDRILVDGGVLDNLPVDHMARRPGPIVAVDVMGKGWNPRRVGWESRPSAGGFGSYISLLAGRGPVRIPTLAETLARTTVIGSWNAATQNRSMADVVIAPQVGDAGVLDFKRLDEMVEQGRSAAQEALPDLRQLIRPRSAR